MYDLMDSIVHFVAQFFLPLLVAGIIAEVYVIFNKKLIWALLFPIVPVIASLYWISNPIKEGNKPTMTAMNIIPYWALAVVYLVTLLITKIVKYFITRKNEKNAL